MTLLRLATIAGALVWMAALPLAVYAIGWHQPLTDAAAAFVYALGSVICHQRPERSFALAGVPWPVCARCTGIYAGAALSSCVALVAGGSDILRSPFADDATTAWWRRALLIGASPSAMTLLFEWTTGVTPGNWVRALAGFPLGAVVCASIIASMREPARRAVGVARDRA